MHLSLFQASKNMEKYKKLIQIQTIFYSIAKWTKMIVVWNCGIEKTRILQIPLKHQWVRCLIDDGKERLKKLEAAWKRVAAIYGTFYDIQKILHKI